MKIITLFIILTIWSCIAKGTKDKHFNEDSEFEEYIDNYYINRLPIVIKRNEVFNNLSIMIYDSLKMTYRKNEFKKINQNELKYLPEEIKGSNAEISYRCIYVFPINKNYIPVILSNDYLQDGEQYKLLLYLICYSEGGNIISFEEIAGYNIDIKEQFVEITKDLEITTFEYVYEDDPDNKYPNLFYFSETIKKSKIIGNGEIKEVSKLSRTGYFNGGWMGYKFIQ